MLGDAVRRISIRDTLGPAQNRFRFGKLLRSPFYSRCVRHYTTCLRSQTQTANQHMLTRILAEHYLCGPVRPLEPAEHFDLADETSGRGEIDATLFPSTQANTSQFSCRSLPAIHSGQESALRYHLVCQVCTDSGGHAGGRGNVYHMPRGGG